MSRLTKEEFDAFVAEVRKSLIRRGYEINTTEIEEERIVFAVTHPITKQKVVVEVPIDQ